MVCSPFSKQQARNIADGLKNDYQHRTFRTYDGALQIVHDACIAPYCINKRFESINLYMRDLNRGSATAGQVSRYLDHNAENEYTVVAVVENKTDYYTPDLYPVKIFSAGEVEVFTFNFLTA